MKLKPRWDRQVDPKRTLASQPSAVTGCRFHSVLSDSVNVYPTYPTQPQLSIPTPASVAEFGQTPADESHPKFMMSWPSVLPRNHILCASSIHFSTLLKGFHGISFFIKPFSSRASWWTCFLFLWANRSKQRSSSKCSHQLHTHPPCLFAWMFSLFSCYCERWPTPTWCWIPFPISTQTALGLPLLYWPRHCEEQNRTRALASQSLLGVCWMAALNQITTRHHSKVSANFWSIKDRIGV